MNTGSAQLALPFLRFSQSSILAHEMLLPILRADFPISYSPLETPSQSKIKMKKIN